MPDPKQFTKDELKNLTTEDLLDGMYGSIQSMIEGGKPDNILFNYFLPGIPFGAELAAFMDIGGVAKKLDNEDENGNIKFTANEMMRSAINFARILDNVPAMDGDRVIRTSSDTVTDDLVDLNSLIASGQKISTLYKGVLDNCKVINNSLSDEDAGKLKKKRAMLYKEPEPGLDESVELPEDNDEEVDIDAVLTAIEDGVDAGDIVEDPNKLMEPTKTMKLYQILQNAYLQVKDAGLDRLAKVSADDPNGGAISEMVAIKEKSAMRRWKVQGKKEFVENILSEIDQLSKTGMPMYVMDLRDRLRANKIRAALLASEFGISEVGEDAYYTALRPNGILKAKSFMKIFLNNSSTKSWVHSSSKKSSVSGKGFFTGVPFLGGTVKGTKSEVLNENSFFGNKFSISYEIVQGIVDRPWCDLGFLESGAYTTVDMNTKKSLDPINEISVLSDGKNPPVEGSLRAMPMTVYFLRNLTLESSAIAAAAKSDIKQFSGDASIGFWGFGAGGSKSAKNTTINTSRAETEGKIVIEGTYLIAMSSRFLNKAPNPDFASHPNAEDWI